MNFRTVSATGALSAKNSRVKNAAVTTPATAPAMFSMVSCDMIYSSNVLSCNDFQEPVRMTLALGFRSFDTRNSEKVVSVGTGDIISAAKRSFLITEYEC